MSTLTPAVEGNANKAHAAVGSVVISGAVTKIVNRILALKYPAFWDADMGDAGGILIDGLCTWAVVYFTPTGVK